MSNVPGDLKYTRDHEWVRINGAQATFGITDHAQKELGDVVFVELPDKGKTFSLSEPVGSIESVKAVAELYAPVSCTITEVNEIVQDSPELVNDDPYGEGWLLKIQITDPSELDQLLTAAEYQNYLSTEGE